jgi:HK97 family phage portal protein
MPGALIQRSSGTVGNPNDDSVQAGWAITKGDTPSQMQANGTQARLYGFERNPVVYRCIALIADIVAAVPYEVYTRVKTKETLLQGGAGDVVLLPDSPAQKLLEAPYYSMPPHNLRQLMGVQWALYGNWFQVIVREGDTALGLGSAEKPLRPATTPASTGKPLQLRLVHPERLLYVYLDALTEEPILYDWRDRYGLRHRTPAQDMIHCRDSTATDWIFGYPRAAAALLDIQTDNEASTYVRQVLHNDGTAGTIFMLEDLVSDDEANTMKERYYQRNVGRGERGRSAFMGGVKDVKTIGFTLKDLEFPDLRRVSREDICAAFGVDPRMIGVASATGGKSSLSGREALEARYRLIQETVLPAMRSWESEYDTWLMPEFGNQYVRFNRKALAQLTQDETEVWTRTTASFTAGLLTREESRSTIGYPDKPDDTDTLMIPTTSQLVPVADQFAAHEAGMALQSAQTDSIIQGPNTGDGKTGGSKGGAADSGEGNPGKKETPSSGTGTDKPAERSAIERQTALTDPHRKAVGGAKDTTARAIEAGMHTACTARFMTEKDAVSGMFAAHRHRRTVRAAHIPDPYFNDVLAQVQRAYAAKTGKFTEEWDDAFSTIIGDAINDVGADMSKALGVSWNLKNPEVSAAVTRRASSLADKVSRTTADQITSTMHFAFAAGLTMSETADLVQSTVFGEGTTSDRATRIARTESIGALNEGEYRAAKLSGVVDEKEWLTVGDDRVRESHADIDGETVALEDAFSNGLMHPGDENGDPEEVINCRCSLLYHGAEIGAEADDES